MNYVGDELDLLAFYLKTGFWVAEAEGAGYFLSLILMSKELDPYFIGRADGAAVTKPRLRLTEWWRQILKKLENLRTECWTEVAYAFLSVGYKDQQNFEHQLKRLAKEVREGRTNHKDDWVAMVSGTNSPRQYGVIGFPYRGVAREERNNLIGEIAGRLEKAIRCSVRC